MSHTILVFGDKGSWTAPPEDLAALLAAPSGVLWVDVVGPEPEDVALLLDSFRFHPLAVDDTRNQQQRPKLEEYPQHLFAILNPLECDGESATFRELDLFIAAHAVVTVHPAAEPMIAEAQRRLERRPVAAPSPGYLAYVLMDTVVDSYFPAIDALVEAIEGMEDRMVAKPQATELERVYRIKRALLELQRVLAAQRDLFTALARDHNPYLSDEPLRFYLRDVQDHVLRLSDQVTMAREMVSTLVELYLTATSNRLNVVVNRLTVITLLIGIVTVVSGYYGMNFEHLWPPLDAEWGALFAMSLMVALGAGLLFGLRKLRWW